MAHASALVELDMGELSASLFGLRPGKESRCTLSSGLRCVLHIKNVKLLLNTPSKFVGSVKV
jgi:hypothetical protein